MAGTKPQPGHSLLDLFPELCKEWDYLKNRDVGPEQTKAGSSKSVWWKCTKGHCWQAPPKRRCSGSGCPVCSGQKILSGYNDFLTINPMVACEWDYEKNGAFRPDSIGANCNKKAWWKCAKGHSWEATISSRNRGVGCPICSNKKIISGVNDFASIHPELMFEWDYEKNAGINPGSLPPSGTANVWWKCSEGHQFQTTINKRHNGAKCPYCSGKQLLTGFNDLETLFPELVSEWDIERNEGLLPSQITAHNSKRIWWKCSNGHLWLTSVDNRTKGKGCPHCSGRYITPGYNDFSTLHPSIAIEWDAEKNGSQTPTSIGGKSAIYAWWRCNSCGYSWKASVANRVAGTGCPRCARRTHSSFPEQAIYFYVKQAYPDAINGYTDIFHNQMELDIYIPSQKIGIEYDGKAWHRGEKSKEKEMGKYAICHSLGIALLRVKEEVHPGDEQTCDYLIRSEYNYSHYFLLEMIFDSLRLFLPAIGPVNIEEDKETIWGNYYALVKRDSLQTSYPAIAGEWHPTKNGAVTPQMVVPGSSDKIWWKCENGHEWQAKVYDRVKGHNCPYCSNKRLLCGYNDLNSVRPDLAAEWNYQRNGDLYPNEIISGSSKKVWWKCNLGHEWQAYVYSRCAGTGCPYCSGRMAICGENDLQTKRPDIAEDWDFEENDELRPSQYTVGSGKKVWWKCKNGHKKYTAIYERVQSRGCPLCCRMKNSKDDN